MGKWITNPKTRKYLYSIAVVAVPLLVTLGVITEEIAPQVVAIVAAILGFGLASVNTDPDQPE